MLDRAISRTTVFKAVGFASRGVTLIELMIALAVVGVVLVIGVPSFRNTIESNKLVTQANDFISSLMVARSEAVKRGTPVTVCKSSNGAVCDVAAAGYEAGWIVFVDEDNNGLRNAANEELLKRYYALDNGYTLRGSGANGIDDFVSYAPSGRSSTTNTGSFVLCKDGNSNKSRTIVLEFTGRAHVETDNGVACG